MRVLIFFLGAILLGCQPSDFEPRPKQPIEAPRRPIPPSASGAWGGFTPDGGLLLTYYSSFGGSPIPENWKLATIWHVPSGEVIRKIQREIGEDFLAILPDGNMALAQVKNKLRFWDLDAHEVLREVDLPTWYRYLLALSPVGKRLIYAGDKDGSDEPQLWDLMLKNSISSMASG
jgi:WD40 repeat protein